jgi:dTDP-4-dehydrorhamnose 3,5-epimerase-like enzyme
MCKLVCASCGYKHAIHGGKRTKEKCMRNLTLLVLTATYRDRKDSHTYLKGYVGELLVAMHLLLSGRWQCG